MAQRKENVVLFPSMAQGHIIPYLALATQIAKQKGYTVTIVNTPLNIKRIRMSLPDDSSSFRFAELPFCSTDHGLPPNCENTSDLPHHEAIKIFQASLSLRPAFESFIHDLVTEQNGHPPLCIITDVFFGWCADVAHKYGVFHALFSTSCAFSVACYFSVFSNLPHRKTKSDEFALPEFEDLKLHFSQLSESLKKADGSDSLSRYLKTVVPDCFKSDGILIHTIEMLDDTGLMLMRHKYKRPVWAVGPLILTGQNRAGKEAGISVDSIKEWLDSKRPNSVVYIAFGSQNTPSPQQMTQLAMALEASGKNFIWVVRPPIGFDINSEFNADEYLPQGFEQRMLDENRGLLVRNWAPQIEILSHKSTGAFLSHCGWNSSIEALIQGKPLIGWPMASEQFFNAKLLAEGAGVCVEVARGKSVELRHEELMEKIKVVLGDSEEAAEMRNRASEIGELLNDAMRDEENYKGSLVKTIDKFFETVHEARKRNGGNQHKS